MERLIESSYSSLFSHLLLLGHICFDQQQRVNVPACSGVIIAEVILRNTGSIDARDWAYLLLLYVFVQLARVVVVGLSYPLLKYLGYGIDWKEVSTQKRFSRFNPNNARLAC